MSGRSNGAGKRGRKRKREKRAEQYLRKTMGEESDGDKGDDEGGSFNEREDKENVVDKGGGKGGQEGVDMGEGGMRATKGVPRARLRLGNPPPCRRADPCVPTGERGIGGLGLMRLFGLIGLTHHRLTRRWPVK